MYLSVRRYHGLLRLVAGKESPGVICGLLTPACLITGEDQLDSQQALKQARRRSRKKCEVISNSEKSTVTKAEGVGPKIAGRIINELKDKIPESQLDPLFSNYVDPNNKEKELVEDAVSALSNLGYNKNNIKNIVVKVYEDAEENINLSELISKSLKKLGNKS